MTSNAFPTDKGENLFPTALIPADLVAMGKKRLEQVSATQKELFEKLQQVNRIWLDRIQSEVIVASEFSTELTAARSIPETEMVYQKWAARQMEIAAEDTKHLLADSQSFIEAGARLWSNGWLHNGRWVRT